MEEIDVLISDSLDNVLLQLKENPNIILTEADFERLLTTAIYERLGDYNKTHKTDYVVHNQISHYLSTTYEERRKVNYRVDCLLIKESDMISCTKHRKGFVYSGDSVAIELKYFKSNDNLQKIQSDIDKSKLLLETKGSCLYVIAMLEEKKSNQLNKISELLKPYDSSNVRKIVLSKQEHLIF